MHNFSRGLTELAASVGAARVDGVALAVRAHTTARPHPRRVFLMQRFVQLRFQVEVCAILLNQLLKVAPRLEKMTDFLNTFLFTRENLMLGIPKRKTSAQATFFKYLQPKRKCAWCIRKQKKTVREKEHVE